MLSTVRLGRPCLSRGLLPCFSLSPSLCTLSLLSTPCTISLLPTPARGLESRRISTIDSSREEEAEAKKMLAKVADQITFDLGQVLTSKIDFIKGTYHPDILLEDNIRGKKYGGLMEYMKNINLLKIVTHLKFVYSRVHVDSVTANPITNLIRVEWRIVGLGFTRMIVSYVPQAMWRRENMDKAASDWISGVSDYHVNAEGQVVRHIINKAKV